MDKHAEKTIWIFSLRVNKLWLQEKDTLKTQNKKDRKKDYSFGLYSSQSFLVAELKIFLYSNKERIISEWIVVAVIGSLDSLCL